MGNSVTGQKIFGAGYFYGVPNIPNPTPSRFATVQSVSCDFKREIKYLYGSEGQAAQDVAAGKLTVSGKVETGSVNGRALNDLLLGTSLVSGQTSFLRGEPAAIPLTSPYTATVAQSATFAEDLGIIDITAGNAKLIHVASGPTTGQYSVSAGIYTFAAADEGHSILVDYAYTVANQGQTINMANQPMGKVGGFMAVMGFIYAAEKSIIQLNNAIGGGFSLASKLDDYMMPSMEFGAAVDANGTLGLISMAEVS